ncbi:hypothetical protein PCO87_15845 [Pectobacteriaceae bacterium C52]|nr:hypothetical protein PCO87_15845 [Pectobacteriaceae bacterium C52]
MNKQVVVFLPGGVVDHTFVDDTANFITASGQFKEGPGSLAMPIETMIVNGEKKHYGRYSINVTDEEVRKVLAQ